MELPDILECLPFGNPVLLASNMQGEVFINHTTGDVYVTAVQVIKTAQPALETSVSTDMAQ